LLYVHNPADERLDESLKGVRVAAELMLSVQARFIWIIFNKQDILPDATRDTIIANHRAKFEQELQSFDNQIEWKIIDLPGFSAMTGNRCFELLDIFQDTFEGFKKKPKPLPTTKPTSTAPVTYVQTPTEAELITRIQQGQVNDLGANAFWEAFMSAEIPAWNHRCHLRAGYVLLLDTLRSGGGIFDCAEVFLEHLQRLKDAHPDRFRNTEHRTMTIFWLYHLQLAILDFKADKRLEKWPQPEQFNDVLLCSPYLMHGGLWKDYYTQSLMMSLEAKQYWRLPDLQALPDFAKRTQTQNRHVRRTSQEEPCRLMRFAFAVVQKYLSSNVRRGWLVKQSLAALQTTTMQLRAQNPGMPPYSETRAYFWIQVVHAALASVTNGTNKTVLTKVPLDRLSFASFRVLFDMDPSLWRDYYTPGLWDSIESRMSFVSPDLKPLPNVISVPSVQHVVLALDKQIDSARIGMAAEIPSMEELAMCSSVLLDEVTSLSKTDRSSPKIVSHAHLLAYLFDRLVVKQEDDATPAATRATSAMMHITGSYLESLTLKAFWAQQVLGACSNIDMTTKFEDFMRANLYLAYSDLPLCYYSAPLLRSFEAKDAIVEPDRRKIKGFLPAAGSQQEHDWVVV
jgi:hypothetical protein